MTDFLDVVFKGRKFEAEEVKQARERIQAATQFFLAHFDLDGHPINAAGQELVQKYEHVKDYDIGELRANAATSTTPVIILKDGRIIYDDRQIIDVLSKGNR